MQSNIASACEVCSSSLHPPRRVGRLIAHTIERKTDRFPFASCRSPICGYDPMLIPDRPLARQSESNTEMKDEAGISVHRTMSFTDKRIGSVDHPEKYLRNSGAMTGERHTRMKPAFSAPWYSTF